MGSFYCGVIIPREGDPSVEHSVAIAMEPHRYDFKTMKGEWITYHILGGKIVPKDPQPFLDDPTKLLAFVGADGYWRSRFKPDMISTDGEKGHYISREEWKEEAEDLCGPNPYDLGTSHEIVVVWCKD